MKQIILTRERKTHRTIITKTYNDNELAEVEYYTQYHDGTPETVIIENQPHQFSKDEKRMSFNEAVAAYKAARFFKVETVTE